MAMRSMKKTNITCALLNVPVSMYKATESHDLSFSQFHQDCMGSIGYTKVCKCCGEVVAADAIVRGAKVGDDVVLVTDDDLAGVAVQAGPEIAVQEFIDASEVDPIMVEGHYYVAPEKTGVEGYALLRQGMLDKGVVAVVRFVMRSGFSGKTQLGILRPYGDKAMVIDTISYPDEVRQPAFSVLDTKVELKPKLVEMAHSLIDAMTGEFDPSEYVDTYAVQLQALVETKAAGGEVTMPNVEQETAEDVSDLLAKLEASLAAKPAKAKAPAKKAPAKKAPAAKGKKSAA